LLAAKKKMGGDQLFSAQRCLATSDCREQYPPLCTLALSRALRPSKEQAVVFACFV
jgi:hypothetical protein